MKVKIRSVSPSRIGISRRSRRRMNLPTSAPLQGAGERGGPRPSAEALQVYRVSLRLFGLRQPRGGERLRSGRVGDIPLDRIGERQCRITVDEGQDRKSTRLNSSHLVISYAVFCLKKTTENKDLRL